MTNHEQVESFTVLFVDQASAEQQAAVRRLEGHVTGTYSVEDNWTSAARSGSPDGWWLVIGGTTVVEPQAARRLAEYVRTRDEDVSGVYSDFFLCPEGPASQRTVHVGGWSVERARWQQYTGQLAWVRGDVVASVGNSSKVSVHQLLVAAAKLGRVVHCPMPLYTVTEDTVPDVPAAQRAAMLNAAAVPFSLTAGQPPRHTSPWPSVSVVIPTRGGHGEVEGQRTRLIDVTMRSVIDTSSALEPQFILVVDDDVNTNYVLPWQEELGNRLIVVSTSPPFNFSDKVNRGVEAATGEIVVILNDDVKALNATWLDNMVAAAMEPTVGAVGAMLLLGDGTIQHAGHAFSADGPQLLDVGRPLGPGPRRRNDCDRDVTGVSAACLVQRREVWEQVGGLDPTLPVNFNDVDYCLRIMRAGYRVVQCNSSVLHHYESQTKDEGAQDWEVERLRWRLVPDGLFDADQLTPATPAEILPLGPRLRLRWAKARRVIRSDGPSGLVREWRKRGTDTSPRPRAGGDS